MKNQVLHSHQWFPTWNCGKWQSTLFKMCCFFLFTIFGSSAIHAQLSDGKVYNFVNVAHSSKSMVISGMKDVKIAPTNTSDYAQLWYAVKNADNSYSLRNLMSGCYLRSSNQPSGKWTLVNDIDANCKFRCTTAGSGYTLRATNTSGDYHYMHYGANEDFVVCWSTSEGATQWNINTVNISADELQANWDKLADINVSSSTLSSYQTALDNLFTDKACDELKQSYASESALKADANYQALPATLQEMALKVYRNSWGETNYNTSKLKWDHAYAKKYRVQLYEPYNEPGAAAAALGLNAHTNLNNPTGIFGQKLKPIYIMVEGTIKQGASLYLTSYTGHNKIGGYDDGIQLREGLNVVTVSEDGANFCINYVVKTFDTSKGKGNKAKARKLSDYDPIKIHIEGGYINGYYNKMGDALYGEGDKYTDWDYIEKRATQTDVTVLGKYITLQFPLLDADTRDDKGVTHLGLGSYFNERVNIENVIDEWDNVMMWERLLLGLLDENTTKAEAKKSPYSDKDYVIEYTGNESDGYSSGYSDYYNVHGLAFGTPNGYMYGSWDHCGYHFETMSGVIQSLPTDAGSHWGPAHEIGHQHQKLLTVNGLTEVTNNLFSNVVLWYYGKTTSRYNGNDGALFNIQAQFDKAGTDFFSNNIWAQTIMYYKLFLYYHVLGHNPKFYPRLFEMLRQLPMSEGYEQSGVTTLMRFYKTCCDASGDDLTEFFRAHGFFEVMTNRLVEDYSKSVYTLTQKQIDSAISSVKAKGYPVNLAVLFINDATGETIKSYKGGNLQLYGETRVCAEMGNYASFVNGEKASTYNYSVNYSNISMNGSGGVGIAVLNNKGELIAFSDYRNFSVTDEVEELLAVGDAAVKVINADNSQVEAVDVNALDVLRERLRNLTDNTKALINTVGQVEKTKSKVTLTEGNYKSNAECTNTPYPTDKFVSYNVLCDDDASTFFHSDYSSNAPSENHYIRMDMGADKAVKQFTLWYSTRESGNVCAPSHIAIEGSNDAASWTRLAEITTGLPTENNRTYETPELGNGQAFRYVRIVVLNSTGENTANGFPYFVMSELGINAINYQETKNADYTALTDGLLIDTYKAVLAAETAQNATTMSETKAAYDALLAKYQALSDAVNELYVESKNELKTWLDKLNVLISECGDVDATFETSENKLNLQTTDAQANGYLYCNAPYQGENKGDYTHASTGYGLLDGDLSTFLHTDYSDNAPNEDHYLRVYVSEGEGLGAFKFNYTTRSGVGIYVGTPAIIYVEGSNFENGGYTTLAVLRNSDDQNPLPRGYDPNGWEPKHYVSNVLGNSATPYKYIRFRVTANEDNKSANGHNWFYLAEFGVTSISEEYVYTVNLYPDYAHVTEDVLINAYATLQESQNVYNQSTSLTQLATATENVISQYTLLNGCVTGIEGITNSQGVNAHNPANVYTIDGRIIRTASQGLKNLPRGVYIQNGKKVVVK